MMYMRANNAKRSSIANGNGIQPPNSANNNNTIGVGNEMSDADVEKEGSKLYPFQRIYNHPDAKMSNLIPCIVLTFYSIIGGAIFYGIEKGICHDERRDEIADALNAHKDDEAVFVALRNQNDSCIKTYWEGLYFAGTVYTTIGYGTVVTCCGANRAITVIYACIGIPLTFLTLERMGSWMAAVVNGIYLEIRGAYRGWRRKRQKKEKSGSSWWRLAILENGIAKNKIEQMEDREFTTTKAEFRNITKREAMPLWLGTLLLAFCLMGMSLTLKAIDQEWSLGDAFYFLMVTVSTIGFGDMHQQHFQYAFLYQLVMIFGLALFSMLVNLVQQNIEMMTDRIVYKIRESYKKRLESSDEGAAENQDSHKELLRIAKDADPSYYRFLLGRDARQRLEQELESRIRMRNTRSQTESTEMRPGVTQTNEQELYKAQILFAKYQFQRDNRSRIKEQRQAGMDYARKQSQKMLRSNTAGTSPARKPPTATAGNIAAVVKNNDNNADEVQNKNPTTSTPSDLKPLVPGMPTPKEDDTNKVSNNIIPYQNELHENMPGTPNPYENEGHDEGPVSSPTALIPTAMAADGEKTSLDGNYTMTTGVEEEAGDLVDEGLVETSGETTRPTTTGMNSVWNRLSQPKSARPKTRPDWK